MSKTIPTVGELKRQIIDELSPCFRKLGLKPASDEVYVSTSEDMMRVVQISFLDVRNAAYFATTTASFGIEFGGLYPPFDCKDRKDFPAAHYCQVRGHLLRGYVQRAPKDDLSALEHKRRDIWWVDKSGNDLNKVTTDAVRVVQDELGVWLERLAHKKDLKLPKKNLLPWLTKRNESRAEMFLIPKEI